MTEDQPTTVTRLPTYYDEVRAVSARIMDPAARAEWSPAQVEAAVQLLEAEAEATRTRAEHPLALVELWDPECDHCDDPIKPTTAPDGKPCGRRSPATGRRMRGITMVHVGHGERLPLFQCPSCGVEEEKTSQRLVFQAMLNALGKVLLFLVLGGNRASKSFTGAIFATCCRLGAAHPHVVELLRRNNLSKGGLPDRPEFVYAVAITSNDSKLYQRPKLDALKPGSDSWTGYTGNQDAYLGNPPHAGAPGSVACKAAKQGADKMQGASALNAWTDEDHQDQTVAEELGGRCADQGGMQTFTMTPTKGWSDLLKWLLRPEEPRPAGSVEVHHLRGIDNPWVNQDTIRNWLRSLGARERRIRRDGEIVALEGAVHADFDRSTHVVAATPPSAEAIRATGVDFGFRDPFVCVWARLEGEQVRVYRVYYVRQRVLTEHGQEIARLESCPDCWTLDDYNTLSWWSRPGCPTCQPTGGPREDIAYRWADSADAQARMTLYNEHGLHCDKSIKDRAAGHNLMEELLAMGRNGAPSLVIEDHPSCAPLIREMEELRWRKGVDDTRTKSAAMDVDGDDHAWDALRYLVMGLRSRGLI